jgi:plasmid stability protein
MAAITIRNVPENVRNELAARAARKGKSLQEYLLGELIRITDIPDPDDWWVRVRSRAEASPPRLTADDILDALHEVRGE